MGVIWIPGGGGGSGDLDLVTAAAGDIPKGLTIIGPDGEPITGTLELTGTAADSQVLEKKTYYNTDLKTKRTGTIVVQEAKNTSLNCGGSYTIPAGYHNGAGKVTANSLSSQTVADSSAGHILKGKTAWVNGSKLTGTMAVQSILSFSAAPSGVKNVVFTWKNPAKGPFSGVIIVYKTGSYPASISDGTRIYKGSGNNAAANGSSSATCTMPAENTTYYFRAFSYAIKDNAEWVHSTTYTAAATTARSLYTFTSSGTFTVPAGVSKIDIFCVGGGGGGGGSRGGNGNRNNAGAGGGGGYTASKLNYAVTAGSKLAVTVGAGGAGGTAGTAGNEAGTGGTGGASSVGSIVSAAGGKGGMGGYSGSSGSSGSAGGSGGSGGGDGAGTNNAGVNRKGGNGGSNGSNGAASGNEMLWDSLRKGQGTTTKAFGESNGTLYAGGGGGGMAGYSCYGAASYIGAGGAGGGGSSNNGYTAGANGTAGTGGGGGGSGCSENSFNTCPAFKGGAGGGGAVLIRIK